MILGIRYLHSSSIIRCAASVHVDKSLLSKLRKSTGYSISHCKKALQLHNNDVQQAHKWLNDQAQAEGWAKATKLSGRSTRQGLLGMSISEDRTAGTIIELNCETDFVARNQMFKDLLGELTQACLAAEFQHNSTSKDGPAICKELWNKDQVSAITFEDGKTLADRVALSIGLLGENMSISRAIKISTKGTGSELHAVTHPMTAVENTNVIVGRFGSMVVLKKLSDEPSDLHVLKHLCLQVIGMNPESVGVAKKDSDSDSSSDSSSSSSSSDSSSDDEEKEAATTGNFSTEKKPEDKFLLQQRWLEDEDYTVSEMLEANKIEVKDFVRMEVGETVTEE